MNTHFYEGTSSRLHLTMELVEVTMVKAVTARRAALETERVRLWLKSITELASPVYLERFCRN